MSERRPEILVLRLGAMGDILFATPALRGLRAAHPGCRITFVLLDKWAFLLRRNANVDRVVALPHRDPSALGRLRRKAFDLVVNLHETEDGARLCEALQARERRGHRWVGGCLAAGPESRLLVKDAATLRELAASGLGYPELFCRIAGVANDGGRYDYDPGPWARLRARAALARHGLGGSGRRFVVCHTHSRGMLSKWWRPEAVRAVVRALPDTRFVVLGYRRDRAATAPLAAEPNVAVVYAPLPVQAEIVRRAALFVGIDSGPRQVATAMGVPVLGLYGPRPASLLPVFAGDRAIMVDCPRTPCFEGECPLGRDCLGSLAPEAVAAAIREMLAEPPQPGGHPNVRPPSRCRCR